MIKKAVFIVCVIFLFLMQSVSYADIVIPPEMLKTPIATYMEGMQTPAPEPSVFTEAPQQFQTSHKEESQKQEGTGVPKLLLMLGIPIGGTSLIALLLLKLMKH